MLKKNSLIYKCAAQLNHLYLKVLTFYKLRKNRKYFNKKEKSKKIRVVFMSQMPILWSNFDNIYKKMDISEKFEVYILAIPEPNYNKVDYNEVCKMTAYNFHKTQEHHNVINAYIKREQWYDLKSLSPDYIFYERPYMNYLPEVYHSKNVIKYAKTCFFNYGNTVINFLMEDNFNLYFFQGLYILFCDNGMLKKFNEKRFNLIHKLGYMKSIEVGHPIFENMNNAKEKKCLFYNGAKKTNLKVLWTPRWSNDDKLGRSNFLNYKNEILNYFITHTEMNLVFRPHPLTFSNFINLGLITQKGIDDYLQCFELTPNIEYDKTNEYFSTFWKSDALITDYTSLIAVYMITGKPIIFCETEGLRSDGNDIFSQIMEVSYKAGSFEDIEKYLEMLNNHVDPLKEKRLILKQKLYNENTLHASESIIANLEKDYLNDI